jgi:hypothetical protein
MHARLRPARFGAKSEPAAESDADLQLDEKENRVARVCSVGIALAIIDGLNLIAWTVITAYALMRRDTEHIQDGFVALAAPHTVIIPTLAAIIGDLEKHCKKGSDECRTETPHWQWYLFPVLVLPLDVLTFAYNLRQSDKDPYLAAAIAGASGWSLADTLVVLGWSWSSYYRVRDDSLRAVQEDKESRDKDKIKDKKASLGAPYTRSSGSEFYL